MPAPSDKPETSVSKDTRGHLPFPAHCRARAVGEITDFSECLTQKPPNCTYGIPFGESRFCRHPHHQEIAARTRRSGQAA
jgi:hypothetical protein